jgi:hypothetical protein
MRYLIFILTVITFLGCNPNSNTINPNPNPNGTNHDWWFEIKVDGVPHRIGESFNSCENPWSYQHNTYNYSWTYNGTIITMSTSKGESDYISGETFGINLYTPNLSLGLNDFGVTKSLLSNESFIGLVCFDCGYGNDVLENGFTLNPLDTNKRLPNSEIPINITQLPSSYSSTGNGCPTVGNPIIGSGSFTIYGLDTVVQQSGPDIYRYNRPYNIEISFQTYTN